ncbi:MAG: serine hydrolase [Clostridia bacterium]|nr:serine hydrolase [Clostridia bacterium]
MNRRDSIRILALLLCLIFLFSCQSLPDPEEPVSTDPSLPAETCSETETFPDQTEASSFEETEEPPPDVPLPPISLSEFTRGSEGSNELFLYGIQAEADELRLLLESYPYRITLLAYSTDGKRALSYRKKDTYHSACTIKAAYLLYVCTVLDSGEESGETELEYGERHYYEGSGRVRFSEPGTRFTIEYLIRQVLSISDNSAYRMLLEHFGVDGYNRMLWDIGASSYYLAPDTMFSGKASPVELLRIWNAVYEYLGSDAEHAPLYRSSCTDTDHAYGAMTLTDYSYSHKSGENLYRFPTTNDAGIVWAETPYLYCMFTDTAYTEEKQEQINEIMRQVHRLMKPESESEVPEEPSGESGRSCFINEYFGVEKESILSWLTSHESDDYYLGTPFGDQSIVFNSDSCMRPNGRFRGDDPHMTCTGFVLDVLMESSGGRSEDVHRLAREIVDLCDQNDWMAKKPIDYYRNEMNAFYWGAFIQHFEESRINYTEYQTISELLESREAKKGDLLYFIPNNTVYSNNELGYACDEFGNIIDCHLGFYWGSDNSGEDLFWHSTVDGLTGYPMDQTAGAFNQIGPICPPSAYFSVLLVPLG